MLGGEFATPFDPPNPPVWRRELSITKTLRFEVFKRDSFTCGYCGRTPPAVVLEVDHIDPRSRGGPDDINNLITACGDCNRGKGVRELSNIPTPLAESMELIREREIQVSEYNKLVRKIHARKKRDINEITKRYTFFRPGWTLTEEFKLSTLSIFLKQLPKAEILDAWDVTFGMKPKDPVRYFCGICWNKIRSNDAK